MKYEDAEALIDHLTEDEALTVLYALRRKFQWSGSLFCESDVREALLQHKCAVTDTDDGEVAYPDLEDDVALVMNSYWWADGMDDGLTEHGWEILSCAIMAVTE
jgi:hypothetical protein